MGKQSIAIVGLGRVGSVFLEEMLKHGDKDINVVAVAERGDTAGRALAMAHGIPNLDIAGLMEKGDSIDILFDLTGMPEARKQLRESMMASGNRHTIIATESIARLIWSLISNGIELPNRPAKRGY